MGFVFVNVICFMNSKSLVNRFVRNHQYIEKTTTTTLRTALKVHHIKSFKTNHLKIVDTDLY